MLTSNATLGATTQVPDMISSAPALLKFDSDCHQVSCYFNKNLFETQTADLLGVTLPSDLNRAVKKRKAEFIAGRYCARQALRRLGGNINTEIGIGENRIPVWPPGYVGSITHTHGYASAVVAHRNKVQGVGLDSETLIEPKSVGSVSRQILTASESYSAQIHRLESPAQHLTLVFSAKESLFKCLFPLVNRFFDFQAATITPEPSLSGTDGKFRFELLEDLSDEFCAGFTGHGIYSINEARVHTAVVLKA
jgi:enterobactin synthetase component D